MARKGRNKKANKGLAYPWALRRATNGTAWLTRVDEKRGHGQRKRR